MYDYYIRLRSKTDPKPTQEVVDNFLKETLPPRETLTGEPDREKAKDGAPETKPPPASDDPPLWANDLLSRVEVVNQKYIDSLTQKWPKN